MSCSNKKQIGAERFKTEVSEFYKEVLITPNNYQEGYVANIDTLSYVEGIFGKFNFNYKFTYDSREVSHPWEVSVYYDKDAAIVMPKFIDANGNFLPGYN